MNTKLRTIIATAGIGLAAVSVGGVAAAQSYGDADTQGLATTFETEVDDTGALLFIQGTPESGADDVEPAPGELGGDPARDGRRGHRRGCGLDAAAEAIGIDVDELRDQLDEDTSIADVAESGGVDPATVVDAMVTAEAEEIAEKVEAGLLTPAEADERLADLESDITERVENPRPAEAPGHLGGPGPATEDADA